MPYFTLVSRQSTNPTLLSILSIIPTSISFFPHTEAGFTKLIICLNTTNRSRTDDKNSLLRWKLDWWI